MAPTVQVPHQRNSHPRPPLPATEYNNKLQEVIAGSGTPPVKFQIILREGQEIVVGRIKVPTPQGHAFILRRFDTGAISLSTMFRACYPTANDAAEKEETAWVKSTFETQGSNGGGKLRLAGTWVPPNVAMHLAESYGLDHILPALANAAPESRSTYRKNGTQNGTPSKAGMHGSPSAAVMANGVTAAPSALIPTSLPPINSSPAKSVVKKNEDSASRQPPAKKARKSASPAPASLKALPSQPIRSSPRRPAKIQEEEEEEPDVPAPDPDQDIQEAKEEVARLRAEHLAAQAHREAAEVEAEQAQQQTPSKGTKRSIEATATPPFKLDMAKIQEVSENTAMELIPSRPIINRRRLANLPPTQKAVAWGGLAFFIGLGASALIPTLLPGGGLW